MSSPWSRAARKLFSPETLLPFLAASLVLSVAGNATYGLLTGWFGTGPSHVLAILGGAVLILFLSVWLLSRAWSREAAPADFVGFPARPHRGLILLVSRPEVCRKAIIHHGTTLERCWLICSMRTLPAAQELRQEYAALCLSEPCVINDPYDPLEYGAAVERIYSSLPVNWRQGDVISDFTGMTANGSVGMAMACLRGGRPLQYTPALYDADGRAKSRWTPSRSSSTRGRWAARFEVGTRPSSTGAA